MDTPQKVFVTNIATVVVKFDREIVATFTAHPNMMILPQVGQQYICRRITEHDGLLDDEHAEIGTVRSVIVQHSLVGHAGNDSVNLNQRIIIDCVIPKPQVGMG